MKHVTFARAEPPYGAGDKRVVPDAVADDLEAKGLLSAIEPWPAGAVEPAAPEKPARPVLKVGRPIGRRDQRIVR